MSYVSSIRGDDEDPTATASETPRLFYGSVDEFVRERLIHIYKRKVGPQNDGHYRWAADWWNYPEALARLEGMWRAWEHLRLDAATGSSIWWIEHADHHMPILLDPDGPFSKSTDRNKHGDPLPYTRTPNGLFPDVRE